MTLYFFESLVIMIAAMSFTLALSGRRRAGFFWAACF